MIEIIRLVRRPRPIKIEARPPAEVQLPPPEIEPDRRLWATRGDILALFIEARRGRT